MKLTQVCNESTIINFYSLVLKQIDVEEEGLEVQFFGVEEHMAGWRVVLLGVANKEMITLKVNEDLLMEKFNYADEEDLTENLHNSTVKVQMKVKAMNSLATKNDWNNGIT